MMLYYVYILQSESSGAFYKGFTSDLERRVLEHQNNEGRWTAGKGPWELVYYEQFDRESDARKREIQLKKARNAKYIRWLIENGPGTKVG